MIDIIGTIMGDRQTELFGQGLTVSFLLQGYKLVIGLQTFI